MDHYDDVRAVFEGQAVTRLLVRAVASVARMRVRDDAIDPLRDLERRILARIIDDDHEIDDVVTEDFTDGLFDRQGGVVRGHDDDDSSSRRRRSRWGRLQ